MKTMYLVFTAFLIIGTLTMAGCANLGETKVSKPYIMEVDRIDQKIEGNRGYIKGTPPPAEDKTGRKRPLITVDVDLPRTSQEAGIPDTRFVKPGEVKNKPSAAVQQESAPVRQEAIK